MTMGAGDTVVLEKPENLLRLAGIINDTLLFCKNDENFKRKSE